MNVFIENILIHNLICTYLTHKIFQIYKTQRYKRFKIKSLRKYQIASDSEFLSTVFNSI